MNVKLISYTKPADENIANNLLELTAYIARISNPSNQNNKETSEKLINYCIKHKHWSIFEHCYITLEINTTRDIARQILRHRGATFQEFCLSGDTEIYFATPSQLKKGKYAGSSKFKLSELYDKWANGAYPIPQSKNSDIQVRIPMKNRIQNMNIKCLDEETGLLTTTHIKEIFYTGKKELYKITLSDGKEIKTTKEHKFFTRCGFDTLENIVGLNKINNTIVMSKKAEIGVNGIPVYQNKEWLEEKKNESLFNGGGLNYLVEKYGINYNTLRKWLKKHNLQYTKKEVSIITDGPWNKGIFGYSTGERTEETPRNQKTKQDAYTVKWCSVEKIEYIGEEDTYDIEVEHSSHNYIANGIITHNSQRYSDPTQDLGFIVREARLQDNKNRQNSIDTDNDVLISEWEALQSEIIDLVGDAYSWAIENGIAKEQARSVLPEGLTLSRMYMTTNVRNWIHYIQLRSGPETQKEHREIAINCADAIEPIFPMIKQFISE